ncbi:MAG: ABC transporter substrate-binding protein [Actinomycetia bacterium]|nr:ABC transporter substrate-binding protein [Actinomycetes bacterium]
MKRFSSLAALTALLLTSAACGDSSENDNKPESSDSSTAAETNDAPKAIISLSPSSTEQLFAIGAGDQVIAVDEYSDYPAQALELPHDLSGFEPNVEAIAALKPDLVVMESTQVQEQLEALGINVFVALAPATFDDLYTQIEQLGAATGHVGEAAELVGQMQTDVAAALAAVPAPAEPLSIYHELDPTYYTVTSGIFIGQVYTLFGLTNIADGVEAGNDYPQLSAEYIIASAPDVIFLADTKYAGESAESVSARAGWDVIPAVANGNVVAMDDDIASRWGPRIIDYIKAVSAALALVSA